MKKAYLKDSIKMFKNNLFRFISIILIIMLGTTFFIGMNAVSPEMKTSAENYMFDNNIFDISLQSNMGYNDEDINKFKEIEQIAEVKGIYTHDVLTQFGEKDLAVRLISFSKDSDMNKNNIKIGREIKNDTECLISANLIDMYGYNVGDKIKVYLKDDSKLEENIKYTEFEIVGVTSNPMYLSKFCGSTTLLSGELSGYIMLDEEVFKQKEYTELYMKTYIDKNVKKFSDEYKEKLENIIPEVERLNKEISEEKFNKVYEDYTKKINTAEEKIQTVEKSVKKIYMQLQNAQIELNNSILQFVSETSNFYNVNEIETKLRKNINEVNLLYNKLNEKDNEQETKQINYNEKKNNAEIAKKEVDKTEIEIEKELYEIYNLEHEDKKFVVLSKSVNEKYFDFYNQKNEYNKINEEYEKIQSEFNNNLKEITDLKEKIRQTQIEIYNDFSSLKKIVSESGNQIFIQGCEKINEAKDKLENNKNKILEKKTDEKITDYKEKISEERYNLTKLKLIAEVVPLYKNNGFKSLKDDLVKIAMMGRIFPVMFFIVAALVTTTTITRMIEEDRKNIGTLKALGYGKSIIKIRYVIYAFLAAVCGTVLGMLLGSTLIVQVLYSSYGSLYDLPDLIVHINWIYTIIALIISLVATVIVTLVITSKSLRENSAELMRPKAVKEGKNIFLEKIPFLWNRMDFLFKICFRNIFRYKRRLFMTLIGIAGCTALIYAGLGLQSSIQEVGVKQFRDIRKFTMETYLVQEMNKDKVKEIVEYIEKLEHIESVTPVKQQSLTVEANEIEKEIFYMSIDETEINKYLGLQERKSQEQLKLNDDGIIITEKLANILKIKKGDKINIKVEGDICSIRVVGITENYLYNYIYFTPNVYKRIFGKEIEFNEIFINAENIEESDELELIEKIKENDKIASVVLEKNINNEFQTSLGSLMAIVILFVGCASLLSFVVLVNLNNINFEERKRELATIKLLGFYKKELESYLFRENIILTILGSLLGLILGIGILGIIIQSAEVETIFLSKDINVPNLVISLIMTMCFTLITNLFMKKKIKNINMVDSLKSVE